MIVTDSEGQIILATEPKWRGLSEDDALERQPATTAIERALQATAEWTGDVNDVYLRGEAVMRLSGRIPFRGWNIVTYTNYSSVREKVNGVLALEIMAFAIMLAAGFYFLSRKNATRVMLVQRESAELRALNLRLQRKSRSGSAFRKRWL